MFHCFIGFAEILNIADADMEQIRKTAGVLNYLVFNILQMLRPDTQIPILVPAKTEFYNYVTNYSCIDHPNYPLESMIMNYINQH